MGGRVRECVCGRGGRTKSAKCGEKVLLKTTHSMRTLPGIILYITSGMMPLNFFHWTFHLLTVSFKQTILAWICFSVFSQKLMFILLYMFWCSFRHSGCVYYVCKYFCNIFTPKTERCKFTEFFSSFFFKKTIMKLSLSMQKNTRIALIRFSIHFRSRKRIVLHTLLPYTFVYFF